jgi:hypothetical protein
MSPGTKLTVPQLITPCLDEAQRLAHEREEYRDLVDEFEQVTGLLLEELEETLDAQWNIGVVFPEQWHQSLRRLAEAILHSPSLMVCACAPQGYENLAELYNDWSLYCERLGNVVLEFVAQLELGLDDPPRGEIWVALSAVEAHNSARAIYLKSLPKFIL